MRIAYFDCISGASGDMILGALVDAGVALDYLQEVASQLRIPGLRLKSEPVKRGEIAATKIHVEYQTETRHRHLHHILDIIANSGLEPIIQQRAASIFQRLAAAEARVHRTTPEKIHFHEVGAADAIADIVCSVAGLSDLGIDRILVSPLPLGGGTVKCDHGTIPVPAPATLALLDGFPSRLGPIDAELVTPTGAAILTTLGKPYDETLMQIRAVGYGAGSRQHPELPNILRLIVGETEAESRHDSVTVLETNIDDLNLEIFPVVIERLLANGAVEAFLTPVVMKKGRPGFVLTVLCSHENRERLLDLIYSETTTLGVRFFDMKRSKLKRWQERRTTRLGEVTVKVTEWRQKRRVVPEFEECKRLSEFHNLPLREVYQSLIEEFNRLE